MVCHQMCTPKTKMQYFGLVGGELGVVSKVDPLGPRPTSLELWRVAAMPTGTGFKRRLLQRPTRETQSGSKTPATAEADATDAHGVDATVRAEGSLHSTRLNNINTETRLLGSRSSTRNRRGELFTAENPPVTKPVEGPEPPAWLESRSGLLCEPSEGGGPSAASLASVGACHGGSTPASEWTSPGVQVFDTNSCSTTGSGGGGVLGDGDDESSAFALSFTSVPWEVSDDEGSEGPQSASVSLGASNLRPTKGAGERQAVKAVRATPKPAARKKARYRRRKRGRLQARSGGGGVEITAAPVAQPFSKTDVSPPDRSRREEGGDMAQQPIKDNINSGNDIGKPQPELYDVWIPQRFFQGKGLPTLKRVRGGVEPQPQRSSRSRATQGAADNKIEGDTPTAKPPTQGVDSFSRDRHHLSFRQQQQKQIPTTEKRSAVHYVGGPEDLMIEHSSPPPHVLVRAGSTGAGTTSAHPADGERPVVSFASVPNDAKEAVVEAKHWSVGGDDYDDDDRGDSFGGRSVLVDDAAAVTPDGGGSIAGWQQQEEGEQEREQEREQEDQEKEQDDDEYFDYAKRFSWQTAAEVVKQAEAEAEAWSEEERRRRQRASGDDSHGGGVTEVSGLFYRGYQARSLPRRTPTRAAVFARPSV